MKRRTESIILIIGENGSMRLRKTLPWGTGEAFIWLDVTFTVPERSDLDLGSLAIEMPEPARAVEIEAGTPIGAHEGGGK